MIVKIFHENLIQSTTDNLKEDLQKLEDKINVFAGQKGVAETWEPTFSIVKYLQARCTDIYHITNHRVQNFTHSLSS